MPNELERFFARISFSYATKNGVSGRHIMTIYNRESLNELNIKKDKYDDSQFIEVGNELTLEDQRCKIVKINFKLEKKLYTIQPGLGINLSSPTDPTDYNCQIGVFVESID